MTAKTMMRIGYLAMSMLAAAPALAETDNFDSVQAGVPPAHWTCGVTGRGSPKWAIEADASAPSRPNGLKQSGSGTFPWCVKKSVSMQDGFVEVKFKPLAGREDQAGGLVVSSTYFGPLRSFNLAHPGGRFSASESLQIACELVEFVACAPPCEPDERIVERILDPPKGRFSGVPLPSTDLRSSIVGLAERSFFRSSSVRPPDRMFSTASRVASLFTQSPLVRGVVHKSIA
jgi:hypothetical protein